MRRPVYRSAGGGFLGGGPVAPDVWVLLGAVFVTFSLQFFQLTRILTALLRLTPDVWQRGFVWQLATYPMAGIGAPDIWFVIELLILFWFARDVFNQLGRRRFWRLLLSVAVAAGVVALLVDAAARLAFGGGVGPAPLVILQGQRMLLVVLIAAFATLNGDATILLFFVLPVQAKWFLPLELLFAFLAFLGTRDLAGFVGLCVAIGLTWMLLQRPGRSLDFREPWLRLRKWWLEKRLDRERRKRGFRVIEGGGDRTVN